MSGPLPTFQLHGDVANAAYLARTDTRTILGSCIFVALFCVFVHRPKPMEPSKLVVKFTKTDSGGIALKSNVDEPVGQKRKAPDPVPAALVVPAAAATVNNTGDQLKKAKKGKKSKKKEKKSKKRKREKSTTGPTPVVVAVGELPPTLEIQHSTIAPVVAEPSPSQVRIQAALVQAQPSLAQQPAVQVTQPSSGKRKSHHSYVSRVSN